MAGGWCLVGRPNRQQARAVGDDSDVRGIGVRKVRDERSEVRGQIAEVRTSGITVPFALGLFYLCNLTSDLFNGFTYNLTSNL
jgi:hypothetical protein